ncbi:MAG: DUF4139 domain-containing protein [Bacteroidota bacterium]
MVSPRITIIAAIFMACTSSITAQTQQKLNIDAATVFLNGAELTSTSRISLAKGESEILFTNVAGNVNSSSLIINASNGVVVESATFQNNFLAAEVFSPKAMAIKDSIQLVTDARSLIATKIAVLNEQLAVVQGNRKVSGENTGLSVAELSKMLDLINNKMEDYLNRKAKLEELLKKSDERLAKLRLQLDEEQKKEYQPGGQLLVKFFAKEATSSAITVSYIVPGAGWTPTYDIMADEVNDPVKLYYKANIFQNSGVKWTNVRLSLSTGNPNEGVNAPVMNPWYLSFYNPIVNLAPAMYQGKLNSLQENEYRKNKSADDASVGGARAAEDGIMAQSSMNEYVSVDNSGVNTTFDIDLPYTIPSDGQQHLVAIKKYEMPATYRYYAIPKLDKDAFLQAQITNWEDLNLLPGQTNIFYEGSYVGQGYLDMRNEKDTMTLSLGRDKKIVIKRERDKKLRSVKTIGANIKETFVYSVTIRNSRKERINLILQDQMPISNDKDIALEDQDMGGSEYNETTGSMKWSLDIGPNETKKLTFGYTVKYPKGKTVSGWR